MKAGFNDCIEKRLVTLNNNGLAENHPSLQVCKVDGHVHLHPDFDIAQVLDRASRNMELSASSERSTGFLLLTEMAGIDRFGALPGNAGAWSIEPCAEPVSLVACRDDRLRLFIVAGRQIVTAEGLEVLAQGTTEAIADGLPLNDVMALVDDLGALAVLPWGVGKWTGARGRIVRSLVASAPASAGFFLADSGVRLRGTPRPGLLAESEANGWRVLAGSDPLPLSSQTAAVGRFGFVAKLPLDPDRPFNSLDAWLRSCGQSPDHYGKLQGLAGFLAHQTAMQVKKRLV